MDLKTVITINKSLIEFQCKQAGKRYVYRQYNQIKI